MVAIEPRTGRILAMASLPSYDPNKLATHDFASVTKAYDRLSDDPDQPLLNRAIQTRLPPGSTFKLVTAAAAMESGNYDADSMVPGGATYQLPLTKGDTGLIDNEGRDCGTGRIPFRQAMENSCNTTFAALGQRGRRGRDAQAGGGVRLQQHLPRRPRRAGASSTFPERRSTRPRPASPAIGQFDVQATPLQMAMVAAGIANGGTVMKPYVVDEVQSPELDVLDKTEPRRAVPRGELVHGRRADQADGRDRRRRHRARPAAIPGIEVAGKTGTAQSGQPDVPPYAWFVSFAPADDPAGRGRGDDPEGRPSPRGEIAGGLLGGPIAKAVMEAVIK